MKRLALLALLASTISFVACANGGGDVTGVVHADTGTTGGPAADADHPPSPFDAATDVPLDDLGDSVPPVDAPTAHAAGWHETAPVFSDFVKRANWASVWSTTTHEMLVFGGTPATSSLHCKYVGTTDEWCIDGAAYSLATDSWSQVPVAPLGSRGNFAVVWSGSEMIVWSGASDATHFADDGAAYDPVTRTWSKLPAAPIAPRVEEAVVFATNTSEMIVWGGASSTRWADGAAYDTKRKTWRKLAPSPLSARIFPVAVWAGSKMLVVGGQSDACKGGAGLLRDACVDGATYDPVTDRWALLPSVPNDALDALGGCALTTGASGETATFWGGGQGPWPPRWLDVGQSFDGVSGTWTAIGAPAATTLSSAGRAGSACAWTGSQLLVWGGIVDGTTFPTNGAAYAPATKTWTALPSGGPETDSQPTLWTGAEMIVGEIWNTPSETNRWWIYRP